MGKEKKGCWRYLLEPEDGRTPGRCRLVRVVKGALWYGLAVLSAVGVGQLS